MQSQNIVYRKDMCYLKLIDKNHQHTPVPRRTRMFAISIVNDILMTNTMTLIL